MIKLVLIMLLVWVGFVLFNKIRRPSEGGHSDNNTVEKMVECSACNTHVPESESIVKDGKIYCSESCS